MLLHDSSLLQGLVGAVLFHVAKTRDGDINQDGLAELGDEDAALLEVCLAADLAGRIELRRARAV